MALITTLAVVYLHMQMKIIDLAYQGKEKENEIRQLVNANGELQYSIIIAKSANNIGITMLSESSNMDFVDSERVVQVVTPDHIVIRTDDANAAVEKQKNTTIISLLSN